MVLALTRRQWHPIGCLDHAAAQRTFTVTTWNGPYGTSPGSVIAASRKVLPSVVNLDVRGQMTEDRVNLPTEATILRRLEKRTVTITPTEARMAA